MSKAVVIDASVVLAWTLDETGPQPPDFERLVALDLIAPRLLHQESTNAILSRERRGLQSEADSAEAIACILQLDLTYRDPKILGTPSLLALAREYKLSAYDATYLALAIELNIGLCTLDQRLMAAIDSAGVDLIT